SSSEGMPVAMIEAAAAARPVVSTAVGGVPELVRPGVTGLLAAEEEGLVAALAALLGDPDQRASLGARARRIARERHSAAALCDRLIGIYERALASRARAGDTPPA
ncbi:MAG: glycosyltransferase, partial [Planctomycetota bacterium]